ncbi:NADPH-protochlorophyllide oxidoreductase [Psidium guajava]|nr:NADPH-protochlorophyllide oxidoreductase [Psidium guajava]
MGKDFGALQAYLVAAVQPERICGVITLGIPFMLPGPSALPYHLFPKGFYLLRWQEPGRAEADFSRLDVKIVIRNIYILFWPVMIWRSWTWSRHRAPSVVL